MAKVTQFVENLSLVQAIFLSLLLAGLYYFVSFDDGAGFDQELKTVEKKIVSTKNKLAEMRKDIREFKKVESEVNYINTTYQEVLKYLPDNLDVQNIREEVIERAGVSKVEVVKVNNIAKVIEGENYKEIFFDVELRGTYANISTFLAQLTNINKLLFFKEVELENPRSETVDSNTIAEETETELVFKGQLAVYRFVAAEK